MYDECHCHESVHPNKFDLIWHRPLTAILFSCWERILRAMISSSQLVFNSAIRITTTVAGVKVDQSIVYFTDIKEPVPNSTRSRPWAGPQRRHLTVTSHSETESRDSIRETYRNASSRCTPYYSGQLRFYCNLGRRAKVMVQASLWEAWPGPEIISERHTGMLHWDVRPSLQVSYDFVGILGGGPRPDT